LVELGALDHLAKYYNLEARGFDENINLVKQIFATTSVLPVMTSVRQILDVRSLFFLRAAQNPFRPQKTQRLLLKLAVDSTLR